MADHWQQKREEYKISDWSDTPSIFAKTVINYYPEEGRLLDLGAGLGQDSLFFAQQGFEVISTDIMLDTKLTFPSNATRQQIDLSEPLPFSNNEFDVVYAHLALHYFDTKTTKDIFNEVNRTLKSGGIIAFLVNSVNDPEYSTGTKLEEDYFETEGTKKRYFNAESAKTFTKDFKTILCDEEGETYKDQAKGVHNLVRYVGKKK